MFSNRFYFEGGGVCVACFDFLDENGTHNCQVIECQVSNCYQNASKGETYCSQHRYCCGSGEQYYSCSERVSSFQSYCSDHINICQQIGCDKRISGYEKFCYSHSPVCQNWNGTRYCSYRLTKGGNYCFDHDKACHGCSQRISKWNNYCSSCEVQQESQQAKASEQTRLKELVKSNTSIAGTIQEVERFSPWFNPNCATVIAEHGNYLVYLVVYEPATKAMGKVIVAIKIADKSSLTEAQRKASELRTNLNGENPILAVFADADSYAHINRIITWPYITEKNIPMKTETYTYEVEELVSYRTGDYAGGGQSYERYTAEGEKQVYPTNPSEHFKPLDIVWIKRIGRPRFGIEYYHVGVYLGNWNGDDWICEIDGDNKGAKIIKWKDFVKEEKDRDCPRELIRFHPIIPFKKHDKIAEQVGWVADRNWQSGDYCLASQNCEHFAKYLGFRN